MGHGHAGARHVVEQLGEEARIFEPAERSEIAGDAEDEQPGPRPMREHLADRIVEADGNEQQRQEIDAPPGIEEQRACDQPALRMGRAQRPGDQEEAGQSQRQECEQEFG